jgi:general secretion pathway protein L
VFFRRLDIPENGRDIIAGIVRSQIEKLMPWDPASAAYGWRKLEDSPEKPTRVLVAGCALSSVRSVITRLEAKGVSDATLVARDPTDDTPVQIFHHRGIDKAEIVRTSKRLKLVLGGFAATAAVSITFVFLLALAQFSGIIPSPSSGSHKLTRPIQRAQSQSAELLQRKASTPAAVQILEDLARVLPDGSFVTELRIEGEKVWVSGITTDAASLLLLFGKSERFSGASFSTPVTRASEQQGREMFHIQANVKASTKMSS